jgi:amino-acid N-acetyltransferase
MPQISPATQGDLPAVLRLLEQQGLPPDGLAEHLNSALIAREGDTIVGSAAIEFYGTAGLLRSVAVDPAYRGQGLGAELVRAAIDLARRRGLQQLYLLTTTAEGYFPRFGFQAIPRDSVAPEVQQSVEFTSACPASALVMRADLSDGTKEQ